MSKFANFILAIKKPKRLYIFSLVLGVMAVLFETIYLLEIDTHLWILIVAAIFSFASINLFMLYQFVCWAQTSDLLGKCYNDLRQYEIIFENLKLHYKSKEVCQKATDNPKCTLQTFTEWIEEELKLCKQRLDLMEEARKLIQNELNNSKHD